MRDCFCQFVCQLRNGVPRCHHLSLQHCHGFAQFCILELQIVEPLSLFSHFNFFKLDVFRQRLNLPILVPSQPIQLLFVFELDEFHMICLVLLVLYEVLLLEVDFLDKSTFSVLSVESEPIDLCHQHFVLRLKRPGVDFQSLVLLNETELEIPEMSGCVWTVRRKTKFGWSFWRS